MDSKNEFKIDITVAQFLRLFYLGNVKWFYCHVNFPEDKFEELNGKWEVSQPMNTKSLLETSNCFMDYWGKMKVSKVEICKPGNGYWANGTALDGLGMIIYVEFEEKYFK